METKTKIIIKPKPDRDLICLKRCMSALNKSTSTRMLRANLNFLIDRYLDHPSPLLPKHLTPQINK